MIRDTFETLSKVSFCPGVSRQARTESLRVQSRQTLGLQVKHQSSVDTSASADTRNAALWFHLTVLSNDSVFRHSRLWRDFVRVRAGDHELEGPPPKRAISPLVPKSCAPAVHSSVSIVPMPNSRIPNVMCHRTEREPGDTVFTESNSILSMNGSDIRNSLAPP